MTSIASRRARVVTAIAFALAGCGSRPECPYTEAPLPPANAGCLVIVQEQVLMVRELSGNISLPGGTSEPGESAQCTAWRETYEETGIHVRVGARVKAFDNGFNLFRCDLAQDGTAQTLGPALPGEIREVLWLAPAQLGDYSWRFPAQQAMVRHWLRQSHE